jgi:N-acyl amino acid synthase FeeM
LKQSIRQILGKLRRDQAQSSSRPIGRKSDHRSATDNSADSDRLTGPTVTGQTVTGQTVYKDNPLRFRSLTVTAADYSALQSPSTIKGAFKIRVAKRSSSRHDAGALIQGKYAGRGYIIPLGVQQPRILTFIAYDEGRVVGTVGLGSDSGQGLSADDLYRAEIDQLRTAGCRVCEFTRLAVDRNAASKSVLAGLFHTAYLYASKICGYTHAVIEVNPRHVTFYARELQFEPIGPRRVNKRVNAPAVLLCVSFDTIAKGLAKYAGKPSPGGAKRTLFHHGFPPEQESGVLNRLQRLVIEAQSSAESQR